MRCWFSGISPWGFQLRCWRMLQGRMAAASMAKRLGRCRDDCMRGIAAKSATVAAAAAAAASPAGGSGRRPQRGRGEDLGS